MNNYVYEYKNGLYFNLTNKCTNSCVFCVRNHTTDLKEKKLWLCEKATMEKVLKELPKDLSKYEEFVFCGYGEPSYEIDLLYEISKYLKQFNKPIRINTNGHGNKINNCDIFEKLKFVDTISISLNAPNSESYNKICKPIFDDGFDVMIDFAKEMKQKGKNVIMTVVDVISKDEIEECKNLCKKINIPLRIRNYY